MMEGVVTTGDMKALQSSSQIVTINKPCYLCLTSFYRPDALPVARAVEVGFIKKTLGF